MEDLRPFFRRLLAQHGLNRVSRLRIVIITVGYLVLVFGRPKVQASSSGFQHLQGHVSVLPAES